MSYDTHWTNYSRGHVIERTAAGDTQCESWLLVPAENLWSVGLRATLYIIGMLYMFLGIAIASDIFMCSIEVITSKKRVVVRWDEEKQERVEKEVLVWNETVANLTLMALGSSAPEILLAVGEAIQNLDSEGDEDGLGTFTIIGSAAFNLLLITAICIVSVPTPEIKRVKELGVFALTSAWSIFAYVWMLIALQFVTPKVVEPWEAWVTLAFFPIMVLMAYCQDNGWWCHKFKRSSSVDDAHKSQTNVRVIENRRGSIMHGMSKELGALEKQKIKNSMANLKADDNSNMSNDSNSDHSRPSSAGSARLSKDTDSCGSQSRLFHSPRPVSAHKEFVTKAVARARFRHAAVRSMMGGRKKHHANTARKQKMIDMVDALRKNSEQVKTDADLLGKFTFASPSYAVLESAGIIEVEVLFHRNLPSKTKIANGNSVNHGEKETSFSHGKDVHNGVVSVEFETREGSGKVNKDYKFVSGSLVFKETEYKKTIAIPIINDQQYEADVDFYCILKNPTGDAKMGDPNVTRVTIIDDDEPGEFQFEEPHYYADLKSGSITCKVVRQKGCDGSVSIEYSTIDGTAKGGEKIGGNIDYKMTEGVLNFKHNETSKTLNVNVNKNAKDSKNFIITLRNPSIGCKIGVHSAAVANLTKDNLDERIAEVLDVDDDDEDVTYCGQIRDAMSLEAETDAEGNEIPLKWYDYLLHFLSFMWKVILAILIPPKSVMGAWPSFVISLMVIGAQTMVVEQLGTLLGCVVKLKASVAGITIVALGTSLPDTFASRTAALHDDGADAAIGNVTGSNSVNVFLGLGLPWVISSMYALAKGREFRVATDNLVQSVVIFTIMGTICIFLLLIRRFTIGGELGGEKPVWKYASGVFLAFLWLLYIVLSSVAAYYEDAFPW